MPAKIIFYLFIFCWVWIGYAETTFAQTVVGMGTENPNPNAVLELVSEGLDQGFLVPRFTTTQRIASSFTQNLSTKDNGLLVFDSDEGEFYYWYDGAWQQGMGANSLGGTGTVWYTGNTIPGNNEGKNGDFYIHTLSGDVYRKQNGVFSVIGNMLPRQYQYLAGTGINIDADNTIINSGDLDNANEIQDLQLKDDQLKITNNTEATTIDLSAYKNNDTNELIQGVGLTGEMLRISDAGGDYDVDLSSLKLSLSDNDPANEIQDLELISNQLRITDNPSATSIDLSPYLDNTDNQNLSLTGADLSISGGNTIDLSSLNPPNLDNDPANEIQDLKLISDQLSITNNAGATNLDLSPYLDNTDSQTLSLTGTDLSITGGNTIDVSSLQDGVGTDDQNLGSSKTGNDITVTIEDGSSTTFNIADDDSSITNETITSVSLQSGDILRIKEAGVNHDVDLSSLGGGISIIGDPASISDFALLGNTLRITEDGVDHDVDMSSFQKTTLSTGNVWVGNTSNVATPVTMSGDATLANDGTASVVGLQGRPIASTAPASGNTLTWNGTAWEPQSSAGGSGAVWYEGSAVPNAGNPASAVDGDYYYKTDTETFYRKESGSWVEQGKWFKPSGTSVGGATITEIATPTLYVGTGAPLNGSTTDGRPGDLYYDESNDELYIKDKIDHWKKI